MLHNPRAQRQALSARRLTLAVILLPLLPLLAPSALADTVHLKNGKTLEGEVVKEDGEVVILRVTDGEIKLRAEDVEAVERQTPLETRLGLARRQLQLGNLERAVAMFEEAWRANQGSQEARRLLAGAYAIQGRQCKEAGRFSEARAAFQNLLVLDPRAELAAHHADRDLAELQTLAQDADAKVALARAKAAAQDWSGAIAAFEQALAFTPDCRADAAPAMAQCYVKRATWYARESHALNAAADLEAAFRLDPALADRFESFYATCALPGILASLANGDLQAAQVDLRRVLEYAPANKNVLYVAGRLEQALGRLPAAAAAYAQGLRTRAANPTPAYTAELRRKLEAELGINGDNWKIETTFAELTGYAASTTGPAQQLDTEHFVILHYNEALAREVAARAEAARDRILATLKLAGWKGQARLFLHRTKAEYTAHTGQPEWTGGFSRAMSEDGRHARLEIHSWQTSPRLLTSTLPHEITHLVLNCNLPEVSRLPVCLHEGFAVMLEPRFRADYFMGFLRLRLKSQSFIPLAELLTRHDYPRDPEFFYAEGYALLEYLVQQKGLDAALKLFKAIAAQGQAREQVLKAFGADSLETLEPQWKAWILKAR